jgi:hypothetical protein
MGGFWPSPWREPDARGGFATWTQGSASGGVGDVHVYDLARGIDRVVRRGHPQGSFLVAGGLASWPESPRPGALTEIRAAEVRTGESVDPPPCGRSAECPQSRPTGLRSRTRTATSPHSGGRPR